MYLGIILAIVMWKFSYYVTDPLVHSWVGWIWIWLEENSISQTLIDSIQSTAFMTRPSPSCGHIVKIIGTLDFRIVIGTFFSFHCLFLHFMYLLCRWVSKLIRKRHESSVTSVSWHPDNVSLSFSCTCIYICLLYTSPSPRD